MVLRKTALLAAMVMASACAPHKLPGTDIDDTSDTRAVLDVVTAYRVAVEHKNIAGVLALADESFRDDGGSANPDDDLDYKTLTPVLTARFNKIQDLKLDVAVRRIEFDEEVTKAKVTYSYQLSFRMAEYTAKTMNENDLKQMVLKRVDNKTWKIVSGI
jgi:hypothetical protein